MHIIIISLTGTPLTSHVCIQVQVKTTLEFHMNLLLYTIQVDFEVRKVFGKICLHSIDISITTHAVLSSRQVNLQYNDRSCRA